MVRVLIALAWLASVSVAHAQPAGGAVALLPLDADQRLELYGQPVASEIARALVAGGIDVVVVGPKMAVPARARLVVDGTITGKGDAVTVSIRIRDPRDGTVVDTLSATAPTVTSIDRAEEDLSTRLLPSVKSHLAALDHPKLEPPRDPHVATVPPAPPKLLAVAVAPLATGATGVALRNALEGALDGWAQQHHHERQPADPNAVALGVDVKALTNLAHTSHVDLAVAFEVVGFAIDPGAVPSARARVRVRVIEGSHAVFDRVVVTDTIVGDHGIADAALAARTAREVLAIAQPHLHRALANWK